MGRRLVVLSLAVFLVLAMAGCGSGGQSGDTPPKPPDSQSTEKEAKTTEQAPVTPPEKASAPAAPPSSPPTTSTQPSTSTEKPDLTDEAVKELFERIALDMPYKEVETLLKGGKIIYSSEPTKDTTPFGEVTQRAVCWQFGRQIITVVFMNERAATKQIDQK